MEPLRKALRLPRINLFIVVAAPASILDQWKGELEGPSASSLKFRTGATWPEYVASAASG
jgi:hypothetical protein